MDEAFAKAEKRAADEIGARIRALRLSLGVPSTHIARKLGLSSTAYYKYETGNTQVMMVSRIAEIAHVLRVPVAALFGEQSVLGDSEDALLLADRDELMDAWARLNSAELKKAALELIKRIAAEQDREQTRS